MHFHPGWSGHA
jgi:hypothetical protein